MSSFRHGEIYHFDEGVIPQDHAPAHRNDEFPDGYSSAGCSPAVPASASPSGAHLAPNAFSVTMLFQRTVRSVLTFCLTPGDKPRYHLEGHLRNRIRTTPIPPRGSGYELLLVDHARRPCTRIEVRRTTEKQGSAGSGRGRRIGARLIPIVEYYHSGLSDDLNEEWAVLDTFDMYSPRHDHPQSMGSVRR